jgi:DNA processing protein
VHCCPHGCRMNTAALQNVSSIPAVSEERLAWLALALTPQLGPRRILRAVERCGSAAKVLDCGLTELEALELPVESIHFVADGNARAAADQQLDTLARTGGQFLTFTDFVYPERLREIFDPPAVLWVRGDVHLLSMPSIAVVGTRHPTPYGTGMAEMLSRDLAHRGIIIASGMARGIDTSAHKGALAAKRPTIAVWGTGIDVIYPKENKSLSEQIIAGGGTIISEFPLGVYPAPQNFPRRNRILSGMSIGVLVVEAAEYSGTRVTARCAIEQNRDVYAAPGNVTTKNAWGPNTLIKQGAKLTATWEDVWEELPTPIRLRLESEHGLASKEEGAASLFRGEPLPAGEGRVLSVLRHDEAFQLDEIMESWSLN